MRSVREHKELEGQSYRELRLLEEVSRAPQVSQRRLASQLGIALGLTNVLLKNLAKKGYIRIVQVRWRSWIYILTPSGITRKVQLTFAYIDGFLSHYRHIRDIIQEDLAELSLDKDSQIAIFGRTELGELAFLVLRNLGITNIAIIDVEESAHDFLGMPVLGLDSVSAEDYAKVVVAFPTDLQSRCEELQRIGISTSQIVTLLHNSSVLRHEDDYDELS